MASSRREAAIAATDRSCPRCAAPREPSQDYCVSCGLRLPPTTGRVAGLRRRWLRRIGWYPGDWIWVSLPTLLVALAGAAVAIELTGRDEDTNAGTTVIAKTTALPGRAAVSAAKAATTLPVAPEPGASTTGSPTAPTGTSQKNGSLIWPSGTDGWTIVLVSYPSRAGRGTPLGTARRAAGLGLPEVGVLDSSDFSSLHPGYAIVFSGVYASRADAEAALTSARATGFGSAYTRQISR